MFSDDEGNAVCFIDQRRFGRWALVEHAQDWGVDRGPDPIFEYSLFAKNVAEKITPDSKYWNKPICEVLLLQEVFNGIGNYLRAEILHEYKVENPFVKTGSCFKDLSIENCEENRLLKLCNEIPMRFKDSPKYRSECGTDESLFKVYSKKDSMSRKDSNGRMIWWKSSASEVGKVKDEEDDDEEEYEEKPQKKKTKKKKVKKQSREVQEHEKQLERIASSSKKARKATAVKQEENEVVAVKRELSKREERDIAKKVNMKKKAQSAVRSQRRRKTK